MAYDGVEVEIKLKTDQSTAEAIIKKLEGAVKAHNIDVYFDNKSQSFLKATPIREWLSVRDRGGRVILNHKYFYFDDAGASTHCDENELVVDDVDVAAKLLGGLGYEPLITVNKQRVEGTIDGFLVSVDDVAELGHFVEIEATKAFGTIAETLERLRSLALELGLDTNAIDNKGYPHLLIEKRLGRSLLE